MIDLFICPVGLLFSFLYVLSIFLCASLWVYLIDITVNLLSSLLSKVLLKILFQLLCFPVLNFSFYFNRLRFTSLLQSSMLITYFSLCFTKQISPSLMDLFLISWFCVLVCTVMFYGPHDVIYRQLDRFWCFSLR